MASGNMIVTLVAQTRRWSSGLQRAGRDTMTFGKVAMRGFQMGAAALVTLTATLARVIPALAEMGAESRKADIQLRFMLENMNGISSATDKTVKRMAAYADTVSKATGVDDEQIKAVQKKLLMFKSLRKTSDKLGGTFDRTTKLAMDLAAAGFGNMEDNATKLGRALEDPAHKLNILARAGVIFTDQEKKKIIALQESGREFQAQELILKKLEDRVGGLAEASATPFDKMTQQFQQMGDTIGEAMLPYLEEMNRQISAWLSSPQGKKDLDTIVKGFVDMAKAISAIVGFVIDLSNAWDKATGEIKKYNDENSVFGTRGGGGGRGGRRFYGSGGTDNTPSGPSTPADRQPSSAPVINFNAPIDSVSAGREVARVLADYNRSNGGRR
jgi:predicted transcriptional regulator